MYWQSYIYLQTSGNVLAEEDDHLKLKPVLEHKSVWKTVLEY